LSTYVEKTPFTHSGKREHATKDGFYIRLKIFINNEKTMRRPYSFNKQKNCFGIKFFTMTPERKTKLLSGN
tara:strand:- start:6275 stop:6487 length:213 start_codon:yes stop_codon:yes gene_type:complete